MKPQLYATTYDRLRREPTWRLLTSHLAPEVLALLQHLLYGTERTVPASVLVERLTTELAEFRALGRDLPSTAAHYLRDWLREGWVERRYPEGAGEEEYELSAAAIQALRIVGSLEAPRTVATESRLALVMGQLAELSELTDANPQSRLARLYEERNRIEAEIARANDGEVTTLAPERAAERLRETIALAVELSEDFRRVREQLTELNRSFRERVIQDDAQRGEVLTELFAGVDVIAESPPGRTFSAFWNLLTDPEESARLEASIEALRGREFTRVLTREERQFLARMTRTLLDRAGAVNNTRTGFARSLRTFVQSREYQEQQRLTQLLHAARAHALAARDAGRPDRPIGVELQLSSATLRSVGQWKLHDPTQHMDVSELAHAGEAAISLETIQGAVQESEIDYRGLYAHVRELLADRSQITIGGLLGARPATQGLGTVVGYLSMAVKHGYVSDTDHEAVEWTSAAGQRRRGRIPLCYFTSDRRQELHE